MEVRNEDSQTQQQMNGIADKKHTTETTSHTGIPHPTPIGHDLSTFQPTHGHEGFIVENSDEPFALVCFVNKRSGSNQGAAVFEILKKICGENRVFDMSPHLHKDIVREVLQACAHQRTRIIVAGGDGTLAWTLSILSQLGFAHIPIVTLPIGIGNELASCIGWSDVTDLTNIPLYLERVCKAPLIQLDTWKVIVTPFAESIHAPPAKLPTYPSARGFPIVPNSPSLYRTSSSFGSSGSIGSERFVTPTSSPVGSPMMGGFTPPTPFFSPCVLSPNGSPRSRRATEEDREPTTFLKDEGDVSLLQSSSSQTLWQDVEEEEQQARLSGYSSTPFEYFTPSSLHNSNSQPVPTSPAPPSPISSPVPSPSSSPASSSIYIPSTTHSLSAPELNRMSSSINTNTLNSTVPPVLIPTLDTMLCFFSIGFDALITMQFHELRETKPYLCFSRGINKFWHARFGLQQMLSSRFCLAESLELIVDGKVIPLPESIQTLQVFNIHSGADGVDFFGLSHQSTSEDHLQQYSQPAVNDGLLEVVGTDSVFHLLLMKTTLKHAHRLAQGREIWIRYKGDELIAVQHDGQPSWRSKCDILLTHNFKITMVKGPGYTRGLAE